MLEDDILAVQFCLAIDVRRIGRIGGFVGGVTYRPGEDIVRRDVDEERTVEGFDERLSCRYVESAGCGGVLCAGVWLTVGGA